MALDCPSLIWRIINTILKECLEISRLCSLTSFLITLYVLCFKNWMGTVNALRKKTYKYSEKMKKKKNGKF